MKLRKIISAIMVMVMAMALVPTFSAVPASASDIKVWVNGKELVSDQPAVIYEGRTMVPLRAICETLGCDVDWNDEQRYATIDNELTRVNVQIGSYWIVSKDRRDESKVVQTAIDVPPMIINNRTMVPARAVAEALNAQVLWYNDTREVVIRMEYDAVAPYHNGLATVMKRHKDGYGKTYYTYGCIDKDGNEVIPPIYDGLGNFYFTRASAGRDGMWGFIDKQGREVIPFIYDMVYDFEYVDSRTAHARVIKDGESFLIDTNGRRVYEDDYDYYY